MRRAVGTVVVALSLVAAGIAATPEAARGEVVWLCRPGESPNPCRESLETTVYEANGSSRVESPRLPANPSADCFFVYPTVSGQPGTNANKDKDPELTAIARYQAGRFAQQCRVYAPVYRQLTIASIFTGTAQQPAAGGRIAYGDVREAWHEYLRRYNRGRPFVLIGHSQGTRMLRQLVREEVDPKPSVRRRLVSALLLGGNVLVRRGERDGGDFRNVPACTSTTQTGCVVAYSAFNEPPPDSSRFGRPPARDTTGADFPAGPGHEVLCTNPASLAANLRRPLTSYLRSEPLPGLIGVSLIIMYGNPPSSAPTPWLRPADRYSGRCVTSRGANVLMIEPIGSARRLNRSPDPAWGLHLGDVNLPLGELVGLVGSQVRSLQRRCLAGRSAIGSRNIGRIRLGRTRAQLVRRTGLQPARRTRHSYRWCVRASTRRVTAVFSRSAGGDARLVATTAGRHRLRGMGPGARVRTLLRRFRRARRLGSGLYRAGPRSRRVFGVRRGRVRFAAVVDRKLLRDGRALRRYLRRGGMR